MQNDHQIADRYGSKVGDGLGLPASQAQVLRLSLEEEAPDSLMNA